MNNCRWCGQAHDERFCPKVKAIEFQDDGTTVRRVEFMTPKDFHQWPTPVGVGPATTYLPVANPWGPGIAPLWPTTICQQGSNH